MTFDEVLTQVTELLQHQGQVSYREAGADFFDRLQPEDTA